MQSGYSIEQKSNRPPTSAYPLGFFVEDYTYKKVSDDKILDENNGRYCITPDYPNGVYAYFTTVNTTAETSGIFKNYKAPVFPYVVGENFKSIQMSSTGSYITTRTTTTWKKMVGVEIPNH